MVTRQEMENTDHAIAVKASTTTSPVLNSIQETPAWEGRYRQKDQQVSL